MEQRMEAKLIRKIEEQVRGLNEGRYGGYETWEMVGGNPG